MALTTSYSSAGMPSGGCAGSKFSAAAVNRGQEQLELAGEEAEHVRLRNPYAACDPLDRRAMQPTVGELVHGRLDQRVPAFCRRNTLTSGAGLGCHLYLDAKHAHDDATYAAAMASSRDPGSAAAISASAVRIRRPTGSAASSAPAASTATPTHIAGTRPLTKLWALV